MASTALDTVPYAVITTTGISGLAPRTASTSYSALIVPSAPNTPATPDGPVADERLEVPLPRPYDFDTSLRFVPFGLYDPSCRRGPGTLWQATWTPDGPVSLVLRLVNGTVDAAAWGPGAAWTLARLERLLGLHDDPASFKPPPGPVATLARRGRGMHLVRTASVFDVLCQFILQQRVSFRDAARSHRHLTRALGEASPGPPGLLLPLAPRHWLRLSSDDLRRAGVDGQRSRCLRAAARKARAIEASAEHQPTTTAEVVGRIPGCGPWTVGMVAGFALGDADAVPLGDLHLPSLLARALVGEARADDTRMLELLEPYRGHRFRLIRLLLAADRIRLGRSGRV
jgi:3-methyladenine DNA glycosylase/8-oxoguanine DNA glycosylase